MQRRLILLGTILLLVGLVLGTVLDWFANPAIASDAHVAGIQHGMLLILLGLAWKFSALTRMEPACAYLNMVGLYGIWTAFLVGAVLGEPHPAASQTTYVIFVVSSWILIAGIAMFLYGLVRHADREQDE